MDDVSRSSKSLDRYLLAFWASSLVAFGAFGASFSLADCLVAFFAHIICFPLIRRSTPLTLIPPFGCVVIGLALGFQFIDLCFDILIISDGSIHDGLGTLSGRRVAWIYYNTMLNAPQVNLGLALFLLVGQFGAVAGVSRSAPDARKKWVWLVLTMIAGNGGYLVSVVPRYISIRASTTFDASFFDGWSAVILSRVFLFVALGTATGILCSLLLDGRAKENGKLH